MRPFNSFVIFCHLQRVLVHFRGNQAVVNLLLSMVRVQEYAPASTTWKNKEVFHF